MGMHGTGQHFEKNRTDIEEVEELKKGIILIFKRIPKQNREKLRFRIVLRLQELFSQFQILLPENRRMFKSGKALLCAVEIDQFLN